MNHKETMSELQELARQAEKLSGELHQIAETLLARSIYMRVRFWALLMALQAISIGLVFLIGGQRRISASAYYLVALLGHDIWGMAFMGCGLFTVLCTWKYHHWLRWALLCESIPYVAFSASFAIASWKFPDANLTAAPVYMWLAIAHGFLSDFARREF